MSYFLSCDWGTSNFRLRLVERDSLAVLVEHASADGIDRVQGMAEGGDSTQRDAVFRSFLEHRVAELLDSSGTPRCLDLGRTPLWISGMASSTIGWRELPYAGVPFSIDGSSARVADLGALTQGHPVPTWLVSGIATPTDILRGEETEALGVLASLDLRDATLVLPGTHSKHLVVRDRAIVDFHTFLTGEAYEILRTYSILRHSVEENAPFDEEAESALRAGARTARDRPLLSALFSVRTRQVLDGAGTRSGAAYLSGLLIGAELRGSIECCGRPDELRPLILGVPDDTADLYLATADELGLGDLTRRVDPAVLKSAVVRGHRVLSACHFDGKAC